MSRLVSACLAMCYGTLTQIKARSFAVGAQSLFTTQQRPQAVSAQMVKYWMGSRKHLAINRWKRARKGLLQKERCLAHCWQLHDGSMYSLACRTPRIIPWEYCSLRDHGT